MPARTKPLNAADGPLARFALELRRLRDQAPAGRPTSVAKVAKGSGKEVGRTTIYAALSGRTLPSRETLAIMVSAWAPRGDAELPAWIERRSKCEQDISLAGRRLARSPQSATTSDETPGQGRRAGRDTFGAEMRKWRERRGISLGETARRVNYSKSYLSKIENDQKPPNKSLARMVDNLLDAGGELTMLVQDGIG